MTLTLRLDPWTLRPKSEVGSVLLGKSFGSLPSRMIDPLRQEKVGLVSRRRRIWELSGHLHCSIVGTCLLTGALRQILVKAKLATNGASEHDLHRQGVSLASQRDGLGKLLHKALDRSHRTSVGCFDKAETVEEVRTLWRQAVSQGEIPGGYWAALTHPATNDSLIRDIFGEVHMLSHLVGAANRADIRRLSELEAENARLRDKLDRQQDHLRDSITARDLKIRELGDLLVRRIADQPMKDDGGTSEQATLSKLVANLEHRLRSEANRRAALEERLAQAVDDLARERQEHATLVRRYRALQEELAAIEAGLASDADRGNAAAPPSLSGLTVLYVGGRPDRLGHLRALSERLGASLLHHDGGVEDRSGLLGGLVSRADMVMFPVDCVSHEAVINVKRLCRQMSKPFVPLRSNGTGSFVAALSKAAQG